MRSSGYSWLICVVMPLAFVGIVCWLTPWLAGIEAQFYDRFVSARPARHPSKPVLVVLEDDAIHAPNLPPAEQARKRALTLQKAVENMSRASCARLCSAAVRPTGWPPQLCPMSRAAGWWIAATGPRWLSSSRHLKMRFTGPAKRSAPWFSGGMCHVRVAILCISGSSGVIHRRRVR